ncbi:sporulation membrane protein YtaF [Inconstantimicrobium mannanitabidum]|uniref:Sporulation membrane protein YtaF n=1 Tax=Inconstantimicrobium mannanitabidum TaxID=1604901 RepID=A0ACB5RD79_9CLOT|nr:sporulation membrane protein YtaF [Clostridium sp. TW13]GKX67056.1 sporulation membrane protein YtaF [Clostridium sp. TW13]
MSYLYTFLIALVNNLDNIGVRIAYSIRGIRIPFLKNLWISFITFVISGGAAYFGELTTVYLNKTVSSIISMVLLCSIGLWIILEPYVKKKKDIKNNEQVDFSLKGVLDNPENADRDKSSDIDLKEATVLGIALSVNNIGGGVSAGMIGLSWYFVGIFSAVISFIALWLGNYLTVFLKKWDLDKKASFVAGAVLIILGIIQVI